MVAEIIDARAQYIKNRGMNDRYYIDMIVNYLKQFKSGTKADFITLLRDKLPDVLDDKQKIAKVKNLLSSMSRHGVIEHAGGNKRTGAWVLAKRETHEKH